MHNTTTNNKRNKSASNAGLTLLAGALLVLIGLPTQGIAGQQIPAGALTTPNSQVMFGSAEDYGDTKQDEEDWSGTYAPNTNGARSDLMSKRSAGFELVAMNKQSDDTEKSGYGEIVLDED